MLGKPGLAISYCITTVYIVSIVLPSIYCLRHGCKGPGELDAFMPAFMFTPIGAIAPAFSLQNAIQHIRKKSWSWFFWPLTIILAIVLLGVIAVIGLIIYYTAFRR